MAAVSASVADNFMSTPTPLLNNQNAAPQPDEDLLAALGLHPAQMAVAHGLASGTIHPKEVLEAATPATAGTPTPARIATAADAPAVSTTAAADAPATRIAPPPVLSGAPVSPRIAPPMSDNVQAPTRLTEDQEKLAHDTSSGSGISQFQQRHPILGGIARVGAGIGSAMFPAIAAAIPGTDIHHQAVLGQDRRAVGEDLGEQEKEAQIGEAVARTGQTKATTAKTQAETEVAGDPKIGTTPEAETLHDLMTGDNGQPRVNPKTGKPYQYLEAFQDVYQAKQDVKPTPAAKPAHVSYDSGIPVSVTDKEGNVFDVNDPKLPAELKPLVQAATRAHGQHVNEDSKKQAAAFAQQEHMHEEHQNDLTSSTRSMIESAPGVLKLSARVRALVESQKSSLGPEAGRWNEFMAGKVGAPNAEFTKLRTDVGLLTTKLMRMHVGARGGEQMMEHFKELIDSGKQSPENLIAALDEIDDYAKETAAEKPGAGGGANKSGDAVEYKPGLVRNGYKYNGGDPTDKANWEKVEKVKKP